MIEAIQLSKYEQRNSEEKVNRSGWVDYGEDNLFPQYLISLYNSSAVHGALVSSIANMIFGEGIKAEGEAQLKIEKLNLNDTMRNACGDLKLQGGFYLEITWGLDRTEIKKVEHIPFERIRSGEMDEEGFVHELYHCLDWEKAKKDEIQEIPAFNPKLKDEQPIQLLAVKPFSIGSNYYARPDYRAALDWIEVDKEVGVFHNNNINNGMAPSFAIHWKNGIPNPEKRAEIRRDFTKQLTGASNAGKFLMTFSDGGDTAPDMQPFDLSDAHNQYEFISRECTDKIMIGHRVTSPALFGVKTAGQLGGTDEMKSAAELFYSEVIKPFQAFIIDATQLILRECGYDEQVTIPPNNPLFTEEAASVEQSYTGIQISSAVDIVTKVKIGELTPEQGSQLLVSMLGFENETANKIFSLKTEFSNDFGKTDEEQWIAYLENVGETIDEDEWSLLAEQDVVEDEHLIHMRKELFFKRFANPDDKSEIDTGLYKIRYRYSQNLSDNSRLFCKNMVANSKNGVVYRFEDIQDMDGVNADFAPKGKSSYSIWKFKGGAYCHHKWVRQIYFRKRQNGKFLPNEGLKNDEKVNNLPDIPLKDKAKGWNEANTAPIDTPSRGKLNFKNYVLNLFKNGRGTTD